MEPPTTLGKYEIRGILGQGAMGVVYLAFDPYLERDVALKVMGGATVASDEMRWRFEREAKAVARLHHPNIVTVHDLGYDERGAPFIAMELLEGADLEHRIRGDPPDLEQKLGIMVQVCRGLSHAHGKGIVHRDVKPANIFVTTDGGVKIMDFGVARWMQSSQTQSGTVLGTADYMSPEQLSGRRVDGRSDIFSVGVILYRLLSGSKPFVGDTIQAVFFSILNSRPPSLILPGGRQIPELRQIVDRALAKEPNERYPTADEMADDIASFARLHAERLPRETLFATAHRAPDRAGSSPTSSLAPARRVSGGALAEPVPRESSEPVPDATTTLVPSATARLPRRNRPVTMLVGLAVAVALGAGGYYLGSGLGTRPVEPEAAAAAATSGEADLESRYEFAEDLLRRGRLAQAFEAVENILVLSPGDARGLALKARVLEATEVQELPAPTASEASRPAAPSAPAPSPDPDAGRSEQASRLAADAAMALMRGDLDRAQAIIQKGRSLDPSRRGWAELVQQLSERREAADAAQRAAEEPTPVDEPAGGRTGEQSDWDVVSETAVTTATQRPNPQRQLSPSRKAELFAALMDATDRRDVQEIFQLARSGADVDGKLKRGRTLLIYAVRNRWPEVVDALIRAGADVNIRDERGWTALKWLKGTSIANADKPAGKAIERLLLAAGAEK